MAATSPLNYAPGPTRQGAPWWLWTLAALSLVGGFFRFCVPARMGREQAARTAAARADIQAVRVALDAYKVDTGGYPTAAEGLGVLINPPATVSNWQGPYLRRPPSDPWNRAYVYSVGTGSTPPRVISAGPDGMSGTGDDIASP